MSPSRRHAPKMAAEEEDYRRIYASPLPARFRQEQEEEPEEKCLEHYYIQSWRLQIPLMLSALAECLSSRMRCWNAVSVVCTDCNALSVFHHFIHQQTMAITGAVYSISNQ